MCNPKELNGEICADDKKRVQKYIGRIKTKKTRERDKKQKK